MRPMALINPSSGTFAAHQEFLILAEQAGGIVRHTTCEDELSAALVEAEREGIQRLVIVGGDGSVSRIVNALGDQPQRFELSIIPAGTGNDLARSLGIPIGDPPAAWDLALSGGACAIDIVRLNTSCPAYFVNSITAGFGGRQASDVHQEQKSTWGKVAYWLSALSQMGDMPEFDVMLKANGEQQQIRTLGFWIANGRYVGGGFPVAPTALVDDGLLDVVLIPSLPMLDLIATGVDFTLAGPEQTDQVLAIRTDSIQVSIVPPAPLSVDGELVETALLECRVLPRALKIVAGAVNPALSNTVSAA